MSEYAGYLPFCKTSRQTEIVELLAKHGSANNAAKKSGIPRSTIRSCFDTVRRQAENQLYSPNHGLIHPVPDNFTGDFTIQRNAVGTVERSWMKGKGDKTKQRQSYLEFIEGLRQEVKPVKASKRKLKPKSADLASAIIFGDAHLGMIAHKMETMADDHDLDTAIQDIKAALDYCIDCAPDSEEGWFINVGDFMHANGSKNETYNGTPVDVGASHFQVMREAGKLIRYCIDKMLTKFNKVIVVNARGNHDQDAAFGMNLVIETAYENEPRVDVRQNDSKFTFIEFGKCLIGINHGDKINHSRLSGVMTKFAAEAWGRTTFRRWWIGHIHHKDKKEQDSGVTIESFHTLAAIDAWHAASGYGAEQSVTMITLHREYGQVMEMSPTLAMIRALAQAEAA